MALRTPSSARSLKVATRTTPTRPSARACTGRMRTVARSMETVKTPVLGVAADSEADLASRRASHQFHRVGECEAENRRAVDMGDEVAAFQPGARAGGPLDGGYDLNQPVLHRHFDADAAEFAARAQLHLPVDIGREIVGMEVEAASIASSPVRMRFSAESGLAGASPDSGRAAAAALSPCVASPSAMATSPASPRASSNPSSASNTTDCAESGSTYSSRTTAKTSANRSSWRRRSAASGVGSRGGRRSSPPRRPRDARRPPPRRRRARSAAAPEKRSRGRS